MSRNRMVYPQGDVLPKDDFNTIWCSGQIPQQVCRLYTKVGSVGRHGRVVGGEHDRVFMKPELEFIVLVDLVEDRFEVVVSV